MQGVLRSPRLYSLFATSTRTDSSSSKAEADDDAAYDCDDTTNHTRFNQKVSPESQPEVILNHLKPASTSDSLKHRVYLH